jgi:Asp/Glu/hydantoin racemase
MECFKGDYAPLIDDFKDTACKCIADGAEVIIAGGGLFSIMLTQGGLREIDGVPFLDPFLISLKASEQAVDLHRSGIIIKSQKGFYLTPNQDEIGKALRFFWNY